MAKSEAAATAQAHSTLLIAGSVTLAVLVSLIAFLYFTDSGRDLFEWAAKKYYVAEAKGMEKALEKAGSEKAQGFLKDKLKKNPLVDENEVD